jgi:anti-sigma factor RsiW
MLSHATTRDWLIPYADSMLAEDERRRIDGHLSGCSSCAAELREVRELNLLLVTLPPAPPVAFAPFWLKLQATLPQRRTIHIPRFPSYRRLGFALAMAAIPVLAATAAAFAAPAALPDNPLYPVKQLEESVQLAVTPSSGRLPLQVHLATERLHEAQAMAVNHKPLLAASSLRAFGVIVNDASAALKHSPDPRAATEDVKRLRADLDAVERANVNRNDDDADVKQLVAADLDELNRIEPSDPASVTPPVIVGTQATPEPTAQPTPRPTPRPQPSDEERHH